MHSEIDNIRLNFSAESLTLLNFCLAFIMFGIALDLRPSDFKRLLVQPRGVVVGLLSQFLLLPILTLGVIYLFDPMPSMALGLILVASCPGGNVSNFICNIAGGNVALSVTLTGLSSSLAILFTPINFTFWSQLVPGADALIQDFNLDILDVVQKILILLIIPLAIGMLTLHKFPKFVAKIRKPVNVFSGILFLGFLVGAFIANYQHFLDYIQLIAFLVLAHNALALSGGYALAHLAKLNLPTRRAICIETGIQNSGLALVIIFEFFEGIGGMALVAAWWGLWHLVSGSIIASYWSRKATVPNHA